MSRRKKIIIWSLSSIVFIIGAVLLFGYWFISLLPTPELSREELKKSTPDDLVYLTENIIPNRGKILAVVTSTDVMGTSGKTTGYELTELARAYYVFEANGFSVDIASPLGGQPPVVIDGDDMKAFDFAFLNDSLAQNKVKHSIAVAEVDPQEYEAVYFVGGKGAMWDFPENEYIQDIITNLYSRGKVIGAVCHGPAALVNVKLNDGSFLLADKAVSSFTNNEELLLIAEARTIFPFLLQDKLSENGAMFNEGPLYLNKVSLADNLVTGQNPWSTWAVAEGVIGQLGYEPKPRVKTPEENSIAILGVYETEGYEATQVLIASYCTQEPRSVDRELLAVHSLLVRATELLRVGQMLESTTLPGFNLP